MKKDNVETAYDLIDAKSSFDLSEQELEFVESNFDDGAKSFDLMKASAALAKKTLQSESYAFETDWQGLADIKNKMKANASGSVIKDYLNSPVFWSAAACILICVGFSFFFSPKGGNLINQNVKNLSAETALLQRRFESANSGPTPPVETAYRSVKLKQLYEHEYLPAKRINSKVKEGSKKVETNKNSGTKNTDDSLAIQPLEVAIV